MSTKFNSKYGFDLGEISNIEFSGTSSDNDQVLILKPDGSGKFFLYPQELTSFGSTEVTLSSGNSYSKKEVFTNTMTNTSSYVNLKTFTFDIGIKTKLYLTTKIDLMGQGSVSGNFEYYHFTTGYNIISDINGDGSQYLYRHMPGHFSFIFNKNGATNGASMTSIGPDKQFQNFSSLPQENTLILQPKFSTINNPLNINNYPRVVASINSSTNGGADDKLVLTIQGKSIESSSENIEWFGSVEFFASIV